MPEETARDLVTSMKKDGLTGVRIAEGRNDQVILPHGVNMRIIPQSFFSGSRQDAGVRRIAMRAYLTQKIAEAIGEKRVRSEIETQSPLLPSQIPEPARYIITLSKTR